MHFYAYNIKLFHFLTYLLAQVRKSKSFCIIYCQLLMWGHQETRGRGSLHPNMMIVINLIPSLVTRKLLAEMATRQQISIVPLQYVHIFV